MTPNLVPISLEAHRNKKIRQLENQNHAKGFHFASAMAHEFSRCVLHYPIVFLEDEKMDGHRPAVLLGLTEGENLYIQNDQWIVPYVPAMLRRYPFTLVKSPDAEDRFAICVDESSGVIQETDGERLYDDNGEPSKVLTSIKQFLGEVQHMEGFTKEFSEHIKSLDLLVPMDLTVNLKAGKQKMGGCFMISEEKLNKLSDKDYIGLKEKNFMGPVYSHLTSLAQIERLVQLKNSLS
jgi:hypothetical protein